MNSDDFLGIAIILGIIAIGLFGGAKNAAQNSVTTPEEKRVKIEEQIAATQTRVDDLKKQVNLAEEEKNASPYKGIVHLQYVSRSSNPSEEYISFHVENSSTSAIPVTGWKIESRNSGVSTFIPKGSYLFFTGMVNSESDIYLTGGDTVYVITGNSPLGVNFKTNKCSGYLSQFQTFIPYISTNCPAPRTEDLSSIPKRTENDACFDYIDSFPVCRIQTEPLPKSYSTECSDFILKKITYNSCIGAHKGDSDFNTHTWYIYLHHSEKMWKDRREEIVLSDAQGKVVDTLSY